MGRGNLRFNAGVEHQGRIYASAIGTNGLFEIDIETGNAAYVRSFAKEQTRRPLHRCAFLYGKEAWFIPEKGEYISVVDLETMEIQYIELLYKRRDPDPKVALAYSCGGIVEGKYLYLVPVAVDALLLIDMERKEVYPYYDVSEECDFIYGGYENGHVFLFPFVGKKIFEIDLRTDERKQHPWRYPSGVYAEGVCYGGKYWFSPVSGDNILTTDARGEKGERISLGGLYDERCQYNYMAQHGDQLFLIPLHADRILRLDMKSGKLSGIFLEEEALCGWDNGFHKIYSENHLILASHMNQRILIYDEPCDSFRSIKLNIDWGAIAGAGLQGIEDVWDFRSLLPESEGDLESYIRIISKKSGGGGGTGTAGTVGTDIWNAEAGRARQGGIG